MGKLSLQICSDLDYEGMVVDISDEKGRIAAISCDMGITNTQIVLYDNENERPIYKLKFTEFVKTLNDSFAKLKEANSIK
jgi:hypothetical protein